MMSLSKSDGRKVPSGKGMSISGHAAHMNGVLLSVFEALYADEQRKGRAYSCYCDRIEAYKMLRIDEMNTADVFANIIIPLVNDSNMSYCTYLQKHHNDDDDGDNDKVGTANLFLKNTRRYKYKDIIACLQHAAQKAADILKSLPEAYQNSPEHQKPTYVWSDIFSCSHSDLELDVAFTHRNMGLHCVETHKYDRALSHYQSAMVITRCLDTTSGIDLGMQILSLYGHMGDACHGKGGYGNSWSSKSETPGLGSGKGTDAFNHALLFYQYSLDAAAANEKIGLSHQFVADTYYKMGTVYFDIHKYDESMSYYQRSLEYNLNHEAKSTQVGDLYHKMGNVSHKQRKYDAAISNYKSSLKIYADNLGATHTNVAETYFHMATVYKEKVGNKDYSEEAVEHYMRAYKIYNEKQGGRHQRIADINFHMGDLARRLGDHAGSISKYKKACIIYKECLGEKHMFIGNVNQAMAHCYAENGDYNEAIMCYKACLTIFSQKLGDRHIEIAMLYHHIAQACYENKAYSDSMSYCSRAMTLFKQNGQVRHVMVATLYITMADHERHQKKDATQALKYYLTGLDVYIHNGYGNTQNVAELYRKMADASNLSKKFDQGLAYYHTSLDIYTRVCGARHIALASVHFNMGVIYYEKSADTGEFYENAYMQFEKALSIYTNDGKDKKREELPFTDQIKKSLDKCMDDIAIREMRFEYEKANAKALEEGK